MEHNLKFKVKYKKYLKKIIQIIEVLFLIRSELKLYFSFILICFLNIQVYFQNRDWNAILMAYSELWRKKNV